MMTKKITQDAVHQMPEDIRKALRSDPDVLAKWETITPLARNEWICWVTLVKHADMRKEHIKRLCRVLLEGKRRPCCWPGCPHRRPKAQKWFSRKKDKKMERE